MAKTENFKTEDLGNLGELLRTLFGENIEYIITYLDSQEEDKVEEEEKTKAKIIKEYYELEKLKEEEYLLGKKIEIIKKRIKFAEENLDIILKKLLT